LITLPILLPLADQFGIDRVHFGLIVVYGLLIGIVTPPMGIALYIMVEVAQVSFEEIVVAVLPYLIPLLAVALAVRLMALVCWRHPSVRVVPLWRSVALVFTTWPVYTLAWIMAVFRVPLGFRETPKLKSRKTPWAWLMPQILACCGLIAAIVYGLAARQTAHPGILATFCGLQCLPQLVVLWQAKQRRAVREQVESAVEA